MMSSALAYGRELVDSGIEGASIAVRDALHEEPVNAAFARAVRESWKPAVAGACVAVLASALRRRSGGIALLNAFAGGALGFSAGMIWSSHGLTTAAARGAVANVNAARDAHWLERHPIDYA